MLLRERCQYDNAIGDHPLAARIRHRFRTGPFAIRSNIRALIRGKPRPNTHGTPSKFSEGSLVRVKDRAQIEELLDERNRTRGLQFMPAQWSCCGKVYVVDSHVRRLLDDDGIAHPISRTVTLVGVDCGIAEDGGCGRRCALYFRDEWLETATEAPTKTERDIAGLVVRVRTQAEIRRSLDLGGGTEGVKFMPEMYQYAGQVFSARRVQQLPEYGGVATVRKPLYILDGLRCSGGILDGGCDRRCSLLWHKQWLEVLG